MLRASHHAQLPLTGWEIPLHCFRVQPEKWQHFTAAGGTKWTTQNPRTISHWVSSELRGHAAQHFWPCSTAPTSAWPAADWLRTGPDCTHHQQIYSQRNNKSTHVAKTRVLSDATTRAEAVQTAAWFTYIHIVLALCLLLPLTHLN